MTQNIVVAYDGSDHSERALDWAILEAAREAARSEQMERAQLVVSRLQIVEY